VSGGRTLYIAGQTAASLGEIPNDDFVDQFDRALAAVLEVVKEAGGKPADLMTFTIFVSSVDEYIARSSPSANATASAWAATIPAWRARDLRFVNPRAKVEIQAIAVLDD